MGSLFAMIYIFFSCTSSTFIYFSFVLVLLLKVQILLLCVMTLFYFLLYPIYSMLGHANVSCGYYDFLPQDTLKYTVIIVMAF